MRSVALCALVAASAAVGCGRNDRPIAPGPASTATDKDRLQGVWKLVALDKGNGQAAPEPGRGAVLVFAGDRLTYHESPTEPGDALAVVWDTARLPRTMTVTALDRDGRPAKLPPEVWIYRFDGAVLEVVFSVPEGSAVPTAFKGRRPSRENSTPGAVLLRFAKTDEPAPKPLPAPPARK